MVTVFRSRNLKFKINENDHNPPHVHVEGGGATVRVNLITLEVMDDETNFSKSMMKYILEFIVENRITFLEEWEAKHG